jgi:GDP-L-fucose synthase
MQPAKTYDLQGKRVWVAGHAGMVGSAIARRLQGEGCDILTVPHAELDLTRQAAVEDWLQAHRPHAIFLSAAMVGGILANDTRPADFIYSNLAIQTNVIWAAFRQQVEKLVFLGSSCIYPRLAPQPISEAALLTGPLEPTNEWYAIAKIAGLKLCQALRRQYGADFIAAMPTNLYGPGDNFDPERAHVLPALLRKAHEARIQQSARLTVWGSGEPLREFLHVDDCADALVFLMRHYSDAAPVNVGSGTEISIAGLARLALETVGVQAALVFDHGKPDGTPRKLISSARLNALGWRPRIGLRDGLATTYRWFLENAA